MLLLAAHNLSLSELLITFSNGNGRYNVVLHNIFAYLLVFSHVQYIGCVLVRVIGSRRDNSWVHTVLLNLKIRSKT